MNKRSFVCGVVTILFIAVFILAGCEQIPGNGNGLGRESPFDLDSPLLIEVWDSSTPPQFLGYDTGLGDYNYSSIILTSKGYCVSLQQFQRFGSDYKRYYSQQPPWNQSMWGEKLEEIMKDTGYGYAVFFDTASDPTANDTPYALWTSNIVNFVVCNPHDGGTYYSMDTNAAPREITIRADYKFYDNMGTIRTWNDDYDLFGEAGFAYPSSAHIGETWSFQPLKKIGGYAELGLPNPDDVKPPLIYKVKY